MQGNVVQGRIIWWEPKRAVPCLLHGIKAGVTGGIAMLALLVSGSYWRADSWWMPFNLLGTTFYGARALNAGPGRTTLAGCALHIFITGLVGAAFGLICGRIRRRHRLVLLGTLAGLTWHGLADAMLWPRIDPLVPLYSAQPVTLISHALFGACLGYLARTFPAVLPQESFPAPEMIPAAIAPVEAEQEWDGVK